MRTDRGMTVFEMLVVCGLLGLLMLFLSPVLVPAGRIIQRADTDTHAQQIAVVALEKLFQDLGYSDARGFTLQQTPLLILSYPSMLPPNWNGLTPLDPLNDLNMIAIFTPPVTWLKFSMIYYDSTAQILYRKDMPYLGGNQLANVKLSRLGAFA